MAIKAKFKSSHGIDCVEAYLMIESVSWLKGHNTIASVAVYFNEEARRTSREPIFRTSLSFEGNIAITKNLVAQAYEYLRSHPDFVDAVDV